MTDHLAQPPVIFSCPHCSRSVTAAPEQAGNRIACPSCRAALMVPALDLDQPAPVVESQSVSASEHLHAKEDAAISTALRKAETIPSPAALTAPPLQRETSVEAAPLISAHVTVDAPVSSAQTGVHRPARAEQAPAPGTTPKPPRFVKPPQKHGSKTGAVTVAVGIALTILAFAGLSIHNHLEHAKLVKEIDTAVSQAATRLRDGDFEHAYQETLAVQTRIKAHESELSPEPQFADWGVQLQNVHDYKDRLDAIDTLIKDAPKDPVKTMNVLQRKRTLMNSGKPQALPILRKIDGGLELADRLEKEAFVATLNNALEKARAAYLEGHIDHAAEQARQARTRLNGRREIKAPGIEEQIQCYLDRQKTLEEAKAIFAVASRDFSLARTKLGALLTPLQTDTPEDQPLRKKLSAFQSEVAEMERRSLKLSRQQLEKLSALANAMTATDPGILIGRADMHTGLELSRDKGKAHLGFSTETKTPGLIMIANGHRFLVTEDGLKQYPGQALRIVGQLGEAMEKAGLATGGDWNLILDMPFPLARRDESGRATVFYQGRLYEGKDPLDPQLEYKARAALTGACKDLEDALRADKEIGEDVKAVVSNVVRGATKKLEWGDHLLRPFCRQALQDGYLERNILGAEVRFKEPLRRFRKAFKDVQELRATTTGTARDGGELDLLSNFQDLHAVRTYDKQENVTRFGVNHPLTEERPMLYIVYEFPGRHAEWPSSTAPKTVQMTHPSIGVLSTCDEAKGTMTHDAKGWAQAAALTARGRRLDWRGTPEWEFPPHVLLVNGEGLPTGIVTPMGRVGMPKFSAMENLEERRRAQDQYLDQLAKVLNETGYLHLYFLYFHQYVLDSPIVTAKGLLGSAAHCGDIHQTAYESLDRDLGGRYVGDCDDLAELYMQITRRQGKLSFVMAVPGHAACGWVEKAANAYTMQVIDTGPPRLFAGNDIEKLVETGSRSYDDKNTMNFDPKSMGFLFRFEGEPTRTPYYLSTRMFVDRDYAETMERVQGYWHFHFYWLGVHTMEEMIAKGDRVPENCTELAGLYGRIHEFEKAVSWTKEALKQLGPDDTLSRFGEVFRAGMDHHEAKQDEQSYAMIGETVKELIGLYDSEDTLRYTSQRLSFSGLLVAIDRPWEAWTLIGPDAVFFAKKGAMQLDHGSNLTSLYGKMRELIDEKGFKPDDAQRKTMKDIEKLLDWFYQAALFRKEDDFSDIQRKYAFLGLYYGLRHGKQMKLDELLRKDGFPGKDEDLMDRSGGLSADWKRIRIALQSYAIAIGEALDPDDPPEKWRKQDAIKLAEAMERAAAYAKQFGSLSSSESMLTATRLLRAFLTANWPEAEQVYAEVEEKNYARLTAQVAETLGQCSRYVSPDVFALQYRRFAQRVRAKAPYFNVVYEAYRAGSFEHARRAAQIALECWPQDEDMKREAKFLEELIRNRLKEKAPKEGQAPSETRAEGEK